MSKRILVIGGGSAGRKHANIIRIKYPEAEIKILRRAESSAIINPDFNFITSWNEVEEFNPEMAIIASPASSHLDHANKLLEMGIHMLIEKPISINEQGVLDFIRKCEGKSIITEVGYNLRFMRSLEFLRIQIEIGIIGEIYSVRAEVGQNLKSWRTGIDFKESVSAKRELGGGVLLELSHELDYLTWIFGDVKAVNGYVNSVGLMQLEVETLAHILLHFRGNASVPQLVANLNLDMIRADAVRRCTIIGELGTLSWDAMLGEVRLSNNSQQQHILFSRPEDLNESYFTQLEYFLDCVNSGKTPHSNPATGLQVLNIVAAVRQSSLSAGKMIHLQNQSEAAY
jgi:predicted dehydrogenase